MLCTTLNYNCTTLYYNCTTTVLQLYYAALRRAALRCAVLCCAVLCCAVQKMLEREWAASLLSHARHESEVSGGSKIDADADADHASIRAKQVLVEA
jgi:hypothetical protein